MWGRRPVRPWSEWGGCGVEPQGPDNRHSFDSPPGGASSGWQDSNLRSPGPKPGALARLGYIPSVTRGTGGVRTRGLCGASAALSHLSYSPVLGCPGPRRDTPSWQAFTGAHGSVPCLGLLCAWCSRCGVVNTQARSPAGGARRDGQSRTVIPPGFPGRLPGRWVIPVLTAIWAAQIKRVATLIADKLKPPAGGSPRRAVPGICPGKAYPETTPRGPPLSWYAHGSMNDGRVCRSFCLPTTDQSFTGRFLSCGCFQL